MRRRSSGKPPACDKVTIRNAPDGAAYLFFPQPRFLGSTGRKPIVVPIVRGAAKTFSMGTRVKPGTYFYAAYCDAGEEFAKGGSNPRLILGP